MLRLLHPHISRSSQGVGWRLTIIPILKSNLLRADDARTDKDGDNEEDSNADDFDSTTVLAHHVHRIGSTGHDLQRQPKFNLPVYQDPSQT